MTLPLDIQERIAESVQNMAYDVEIERNQQQEKWGTQRHPYGVVREHVVRMQRDLVDQLADSGNSMWLEIALEELFEAFEEGISREDREKELIQAIAVLTAILEQVQEEKG